MSMEQEYLAHESGLDLDEITEYALTKDDFKFECSHCGYIGSDFKDMEEDKDIWGTCPKCHRFTIVNEITNSPT